MTVTLSWPATLPLPTMNGYGIDDQPRMIRTSMEAGTARQRRTSRQAPAEISARWVFTLYEYALFEAWLEHRAVYGANWFNITYLGGVGRVPCEARFKEGKAPSKFQNGAIVVVTATLEVRERPKLSRADLDSLIDEAMEPFFAAIDAFHRLIGTDLWVSGDDLYLIDGENNDLLFASVRAFHSLMATPLWASGDDLYVIIGEDMAYLLAQCAAFHTLMTNAPSQLWTN